MQMGQDSLSMVSLVQYCTVLYSTLLYVWILAWVARRGIRGRCRVDLKMRDAGSGTGSGGSEFHGMG